MGGVGLSRLWDSHPRLAFVLHLTVTVLIGIFTVSLISSGAGWGSVLLVIIGFLLMAASLVFLTWFAIQNQWQPDNEYSGSGARPLPSLRAAWANAQARERILWGLFVLAFFGGLALTATKNFVGIVLVVLTIPLAAVAVRAEK